MKKFACLVTTLAATGLNPPGLHAESERNPFSPWYLNDRAQGWYFDTFLGVEREPAYTGSDQYSTEADADIRVFYKSERDHRYFASLGEIGAYFKLDNRWLLGTVFEYEGGRDNSDDPILTGFETVEDTVEAQISLFRRWGDFNAALVLQPDILSRGKGLVYFVGLSYDKLLTPRLRFNTTLDISFADAEHINTEVGITEAVAARTGLSAYEAGSGYKSTTLGLALGYDIAPNWQLIANLETEFYGGKMADSPLIEDEGKTVNYEASIAVRYSF